jgi:hypothetical protein
MIGTKVAQRAGRLLKRGKKTAPKAADEAVETGAKTSDEFLPARKGSQGRTETPEHLFDAGSLGAVSRVKDSWGNLSRLQKGAIGAGAGTGVAMQALGIGPDLPQGWAIDGRYDTGPGGTRIRVDENGQVLGYFVKVGDEGSDWVIVTASGAGVRAIRPEVSPRPTFDSVDQADTAYHKWAERQTDPEKRTDPSAGDQPSDRARQGPWERPERIKRLNYGWHLFEQSHRETQRQRYYIVGKSPRGGRLIYIGDGGDVKSSAVPHKSVDDATAAYNEWRQANQRGNATVPDTDTDRPDPADIAWQSGSVLGGLGSSPVLLAGAAGFVGVIALVLLGVL